MILSALLALAVGLTPQEQVEAFRARALAERTKLGLDKDPVALAAKYPTPELQFAGPALAADAPRPPTVLCPGQSAAIVLEGTLPPKSGVFVMSEDLEVQKPKATTKKWSATLKVKPEAPPGQVGIQVIGAVSGAGRWVRGLVIGCKHTWVLTLANGETLTAKTDWDGGDRHLQVQVESSRGGQALGNNPYSLILGNGFALFNRVKGSDEVKAEAAASRGNSPEIKALDAKRAELIKAAKACNQLQGDERAGCHAKVNPELQAVNAQRQNLVEALRRNAAPQFGCDRLRLEAVRAGTFTGHAEGCVGAERGAKVQLTGRYTSP